MGEEGEEGEEEGEEEGGEDDDMSYNTADGDHTPLPHSRRNSRHIRNSNGDGDGDDSPTKPPATHPSSSHTHPPHTTPSPAHHSLPANLSLPSLSSASRESRESGESGGSDNTPAGATPTHERGAGEPQNSPYHSPHNSAQHPHPSHHPSHPHSSLPDLDLIRANIIQCILLGDAQAATDFLKEFPQKSSVLFEPAAASELLLQALKDPGLLVDAVGCLALLTAELGANVDHRETEDEGAGAGAGAGGAGAGGAGMGVGVGTGRTALHYAALSDSPLIGEALIFHGADILLPDNDNNTPLSLSLAKGADWLLQAFEVFGQKELLRSGRKKRIFGYVKTLFLAGLATHLGGMLEGGDLEVSAAEAGEILGLCEGAFEGMREPVETFELLEALGALQG
ncbi:hypothetical protein B484DRAFT_46547 [Ochromonadaceae sp. CCMP2298]|nr:hypothetical protein B484DRAFT_46547 [Ochromonadaceae sp. CCMP2298]